MKPQGYYFIEDVQMDKHNKRLVKKNGYSAPNTIELFMNFKKNGKLLSPYIKNNKYIEQNIELIELIKCNDKNNASVLVIKKI